MNIAKILKDCPQGTKLYCPIFGEVKLWEIKLTEDFPITICFNDNDIESFTADGRLYNTYNNAECMLFPSKENRDWSTFKVPKKEYEFKPFDKVLVRDTDDGEWCIELFSYIEPNNTHKYVCLTTSWDQCIPYEGNEHLLGTSNPA